MGKETTLKRKKVSKKLKTSWRKHINVDDVNDYLVEKDFEERFLGEKLSTVPDDKLYFYDVKTEEQLLSSKEKRKVRAKNAIRSFLPVLTTTPNKRSSNLKEGEQILTSKESRLMADRRLSEINKEWRSSKLINLNQDLWGEDTHKGSFENQWINTNVKKHNGRHVDTPFLKSKSQKRSIQTNIMTAELPLPGMSYNPSFQEHQNLLNIVAEKEQMLAKEERHLHRVTTGMFKKISEPAKHELWVTEMSQQLSNSKDSAGEEDGETRFISQPVKTKKKTLKQIRKRKQEIILKNAQLIAKREKKKLLDINKLRTIESEILKQDYNRQNSNEKRKLAKLRKACTKRLSASKFEEPDLDFNNIEDLHGNLRNVHKEGNLLFDQYKHLQKKNLLEPSKKMFSHKKKLKKFVKSDHKDEIWMKTVARPIYNL